MLLKMVSDNRDYMFAVSDTSAIRTEIGEILNEGLLLYVYFILTVNLTKR